MAESRRPDATAWATIGGGLIALGAVLWGIGSRFAPPRSADVASAAWWESVLSSWWFLAAIIAAGIGALAVIGAGLSLLFGRRGPKYVTMTEPYRDGAHYIVLARTDGEDLGFAVPRVYLRRRLRRDRDQGEPQTLNRGEQVRYCFPNHFPKADQPPEVGKYVAKWSVAEHAEEGLRKGRAGLRVMRTRFEVSRVDQVETENVLGAAGEPERPNAPRDPDKDYTAIPKHEVGGQGGFRYVKATLHEVGNGYDHGVLCEITTPDGHSSRAAWNGLDTPVMRRIVANDGHGIYARDEGAYRIRWWNTVPPDYSPEVIAEETVSLGPTAPLDGWYARHEPLGSGGVRLVVEREAPNVEPISGFRCTVRGPGDYWEVDDRSRQGNWFDPPTAKGLGLFEFPADFGDAPKVEDLRDGYYEVAWTAWKIEDGRTAEPLDVGHDRFHVDRESNIE